MMALSKTGTKLNIKSHQRRHFKNVNERRNNLRRDLDVKCA